MELRDGDRTFGGTIAQIYERHLVPLLFEPYAQLLAERVAVRRPTRVLEVAAGTGVLTRAMRSRLPSSVAIVATDLNQAMLDQAIAIGTAGPVEWQQADALALPFPDASVDVIACQFGAMFFPDKTRAFAEARRVLAPDGVLVFSVWDQLETNEFADTVTAALAAQCPLDPPTFLRRVPHGYFDRGVIAADLAAAGFSAAPNIETIAARSRAASARDVALAYCHGTPLRTELEMRSNDLSTLTRRAEDALTARFGHGTVDGRMQAHLISVRR